ncbi:hypothetical protein KCP69_13205 [Salmonella enterica subsp. enterica]|nr:hypothetical protein KCP69_13205 [Salmonella enterica subsp. enterica]
MKRSFENRRLRIGANRGNIEIADKWSRRCIKYGDLARDNSKTYDFYRAVMRVKHAWCRSRSASPLTLGWKYDVPVP